MNAFAKFGLIEFSNTNIDMYDCFHDMCEKIIAGDRDTIDVVEPIIRNVQMDIFREQEHIYISIKDNDAEYEEPFEIFAAYIEDLPEEYYTELIPDHYPRKFTKEAYEFFKYTDEGKKCMEEFDPNNGKVEEVTNMLTYK